MAKPTDLEGRFDKAMKKGEKQDKAKRTTSDGYMPRGEKAQANKDWYSKSAKTAGKSKENWDAHMKGMKERGIGKEMK